MPDIGTNKNKEFWMPAHTRVCVTATGAVLLDLKRNRYFGLGYREARSLSTLAANWAASSTPSGHPLEPMQLEDAARLADALVKAGFLTPVAPTEPGPSFAAIDSNAALTSVGYELAAAAASAPASHRRVPARLYLGEASRGLATCSIRSPAKLRKVKPA